MSRDVVLPEELDSKDHITIKFKDQEKEIKLQINNINNRINDLKNHLLDLIAANNHLKLLIKSESDMKKITSYYAAIKNNTELIIDLFKTEAVFENIKAVYFKEVTNVLSSRFRIVAIDIVKIEKKIGDLDNSFYENFNETLKAIEKSKSTLPSQDVNGHYEL